MNNKKIYQININEYLYVRIIYQNGEITIENTNCPIETLSFIKNDTKILMKYTDYVIGEIDIKTGHLFSLPIHVTTTETRNYTEDNRANGSNNDFHKNRETFNKHRSKGIEYPIELHTHFMEVLSAEEFLEIIFTYIDAIPIDNNGLIVDCEIDSNNPTKLDYSKVSRWLSKEEALKNPNFFSQLRITTEKQTEFNNINLALKKRNYLIDLVGYKLSKSTLEAASTNNTFTKANSKDIISEFKTQVYVDMLIKSLQIQKKQGVKYIEFSYSNANTILKIIKELKKRDYHIEGIKYKFLLSENRNSKYSIFKKNTNKLKELLHICPEVIGFDIMGIEHEILPYDFEDNEKLGTSLYNKLKLVVETLLNNSNKKTTLRLHAGEMFYKREGSLNNNPTLILKILQKIEQELNIVLKDKINIRIGHGLHFQENDEYFNLLKHFGVTVEICTSSNFALGNITDLSNIPYDKYKKRKIPVVLGTDGGGFYLTTLNDESRIAETFSGEGSSQYLLDNSDEFKSSNEGNLIEETPPKNYDINSLEENIKNENQHSSFIKKYENAVDQKQFINEYFMTNEYKMDIEDNHYFPHNITEIEKLKMEYVQMQAFYHDKIINESFYDTQESNIIYETLQKINSLIQSNDLLTAGLFLVSLQITLNVDVKLEKLILYMNANDKKIQDYINIESFYEEKNKNFGRNR